MARAQGTMALAILVALGGCEESPPLIEQEPAAAVQHEERFAAGAEAFSRYCALCHGADATGYAADHAPSLVSRTFLETASDDFISRGIRDGRPGTAMAPYAKVRGGPLDDAEVESIVAFLRERGPARAPLPTTAVIGDPERGELVYTASCQRCHGTRTDRGDAVHLANTMLLASASDAFLRYAVVHGRPGTPMPAFDGVLRDDQIDNVVAYLRTLATPPPVPRRAPPEPPPLGQVILNPSGGPADLQLRDGRFASIDSVHRAFEDKKRLVIIDARPASDWYTLHIPGSVSVPYYSLQRLDGMPKDGTWIIAYCACPHHASGAVVDELRRRGYPHTAVLDEGIFAWQHRGYPTATEPLPEDGATSLAVPPSRPPGNPLRAPARKAP
jgi:cytochrome c oxidase cbb3-type subunit 3/ubiquinol-cytochrome c reductase cytochrome c subunit